MATGESITGFFKRLGFELKNARTSWGGLNGTAILLRTWDNEMLSNPRRVLVFRKQPQDGKPQHVGRAERKVHLRKAWAGGIAVYTVIVTPKLDKITGEKSSGDFRNDVVFPIERFLEEDDAIYALYGAPVPVAQLSAHMQAYKIEPTEAALPAALADDDDLPPDDPAKKAAFLAEGVRNFLIEAARKRKTVQYTEMRDAFGLNFRTELPVLDDIGNRCLALGEPNLTALVVNQSGRCGEGFFKTFKVDEDRERDLVWKLWGAVIPQPPARVDWADDELQATVACYREMMRLVAANTPFVKSQRYSELAARFNRRNAGAYERRMQNISYLLESRGLPWLRGLPPQAHVGSNVEPRLLLLLQDFFTELAEPLALPEEVPENQGVIEGAKKQITVNAYERDPSARARCIKRWGCACVACGFDFGAIYGKHGEGFIHVHHLTPLHTIGEAYELNPEEHLRPVCPNCHAMLHRGKELMAIEHLQSLLRERATSPVG